MIVTCLALMAGPAAALDLSCQADTQCRGDATTMCAASDLRVDVRPSGTGTGIWLDGQGPYPASREKPLEGNTLRLVLDVFGGRFSFDLAADMTFTYRGNRGKIFTGRCMGGL